jgi:hypothetical protein
MMTAEEVKALEVRVGNGIEWLSEHDPHGRFYAWWQAGLTPISPLPAHEATPEVREQWQAWYAAKVTFDKLDRRLAVIEERHPQLLSWPAGWKPASAVRP